MSIEIEILGKEAIARKFKRVTPDVAKALRLAMDRAMIRLQNYVKFGKLSGQVLKNRTGTLRRSINYKVMGGDGEEGKPVVGQVGTNLEYARTHELGLTIPAHTVTVNKAKALAWSPSGITAAMQAMRFAHSVNIPAVTMPKRSFLASGLNDQKTLIFDDLRAATASGLQAAAGGQ